MRQTGISKSVGIGLLAVLIAAATLLVPVGGSVAEAAASESALATAAFTKPPVTKLCAFRQHVTVKSKYGSRYDIVNDNFAGRAECITNRRKRPNFLVTKSRAHSNGPEVQAFPFILSGCSWGLCTPGVPLPAQAKNLRAVKATWYTTLRTSGRWNAAFDLWFGRQRSSMNGQAKGAELMVWLQAGDFPVGRHVRVISIGSHRYHFHHWRANHSGIRWNYIQFRFVRGTNHVRYFNLLPVIKRAERMGLVRRWWWLLNVEAGFEIWRGGKGLGVKSFSTHIETARSLRHKK
jgi:Glycosyl hydrolase family 12